MVAKADLTPFNEAVANMSMEKSPFFHEYVFYMHLIAQCKITYDLTLRAPAAVSFHKDHYTLYLNPLNHKGIDKEGKEVTLLGFNMEMPLEHRIGILKHEMLHIALGHVGRFKLHVDPEGAEEGHIDEKSMRAFLKFNFGADCALNQSINRDHLPKGAIYPDNFPNPKAIKHPKESAEFYYDLLHDDDMKNAMKSFNPAGSMMPEKDKNGEGSGEDEGEGVAVGAGDHSTWLRSEGDNTFQAEITKRMVERAATETTKAKGKLPSSYSDMIDNLTIRREVNWKQMLRRIVGNKKANQRKTLLRKDRRLPHANWIKGRVKDRIFELGVIADVSGSVSDEALYSLWGEIISICDTFKVPVKMVQVDTSPSEPEQLTRSTKKLERKHREGTYLSPAIEMFKEKGVKFDALVVTTDGYLFDADIDLFLELKKPVIWLIEEDGQIMSEMNQGQMRAVKLSKEKK
jgi:predicted metal-dependent peptidase